VAHRLEFLGFARIASTHLAFEGDCALRLPPQSKTGSDSLEGLCIPQPLLVPSRSMEVRAARLARRRAEGAAVRCTVESADGFQSARGLAHSTTLARPRDCLECEGPERFGSRRN